MSSQYPVQQSKPVSRPKVQTFKKPSRPQPPRANDLDRRVNNLKLFWGFVAKRAIPKAVLSNPIARGLSYGLDALDALNAAELAKQDALAAIYRERRGIVFHQKKRQEENIFLPAPNVWTSHGSAKWNFGADCAGGGDTFPWTETSFQGSFPCPQTITKPTVQTLAWGDPSAYIAANPGGSWYAMKFWHDNGNGTISRTRGATYDPVSGSYSPADDPYFDDVGITIIVPFASAAVTIDPSAQPILGAAITPKGVPYAIVPDLVQNPSVPWQVQRQAGYEVPLNASGAVDYSVREADDKPLPSSPAKPLVRLPNTAIPYLFPPVTVSEASASAFPALAPYHVRRPPNKGEKERKLRAAGTYKIVQLLNSVTEAVDFIDSVYKGLPTQYRPRYKGTRFVLRHPTPQQKLKAIFDHYDKIDLTDAVKALLSNEAEDRFYGSIGQRLGKRARELRLHGDLPIGFQTGRAL